MDGLKSVFYFCFKLMNSNVSNIVNNSNYSVSTAPRIIPTRLTTTCHELKQETKYTTQKRNTPTFSMVDASLKQNKTFIFGDIEGNKKLFNSTIETLTDNIIDENCKFIFLGDLYDYDKPNETISMINDIMNMLNIPIINVFNELTREIDIIRSFRKLWKNKQMANI